MSILPRRAAAFLASLALLAVPARGVLACEMEGAATGGAPGAAHHAATVGHPAAAVAHHAATVGHHEAAGEHQDAMAVHPVAPATPPLEAPAGQPSLPCDHLVGCAPVALAIDAERLPELGAPSAALVPFTARWALSPVRALEPPPPKR